MTVSSLFLSYGSDVLPAYVTKLLFFPAQFGRKHERNQLLLNVSNLLFSTKQKVVHYQSLHNVPVSYSRTTDSQDIGELIQVLDLDLVCWYLRHTAKWLCSGTNKFSLYPTGLGF
jgi:hypothetical protein